MAADVGAPNEIAVRISSGWAKTATHNTVVLRPELEAAKIGDVELLADRVFTSPLLKLLYNCCLYPGAYMFFLLAGPWTYLWGPFAVAYMVGRPLVYEAVLDPNCTAAVANLTELAAGINVTGGALAECEEWHDPAAWSSLC